jgi:serine/threonine-protein kinase
MFDESSRRGPVVVGAGLSAAITNLVLFSKFGDGAEAPPVTTVPNLEGVRIDQARVLLQARGLVLSVSEPGGDPVFSAGAIVGQSPLPGSEVPPGSVVRISLGRPPSTVLLPALVGLKPEDAERELVARGLKPGAIKTEPSETMAPGLVVETEPAAGSAVAAGATVALIVAAVPPRPVPNVVGKSLASGRKLLEEAGFHVGAVKYRYDPCCDEYTILKQTPSEDDHATPGAAVDLVVDEPG